MAFGVSACLMFGVVCHLVVVCCSLVVVCRLSLVVSYVCCVFLVC